MKCNIFHELGGARCNLEKGHEGNCRSKSEHRTGGSIMYAEWVSKNGKFHRHVQYKSFYPKNVAK